MADRARSTGLNLFTQQSKALLVKNYKLSLRSKLATFLQLVSSLFFVFLVFAVDRAIQARTKDETTFKNLFKPERFPVGGVPRCQDGYFMKKDCLDFVYSNDNNSPEIEEIIQNIRTQHAPRQLSIEGFPTPEAVDEYLLSHPMTVGGALLFTVIDRSGTPPLIGYGLQTNATVKNVRGIYEDSVLKFQIPLQMAAEWAIANYTLSNAPAGGRNLERWDVTYSEYAHPAIESFSSVAIIGPLFFLAATMFGFVIQMGAIVQERELKLRQAMSTMGLMNSVFWLTWLLWEILLVFISSILLVLFGMMFQFDFFLNNDFGVLFFTFFFFQFNMVGFAFMFSTFISKSSSATTFGFVVFILGVLTQFVTSTGLIYREQTSSAFRTVWSFWPPNLLALALSYLGKETATPQSPGISWARRDTKCEECLLSVVDVWGWMIGTFFLWFVLAVYLDNILPDPNGIKRPCFYFLQPSYWTGKGSVAEGGGCCTCMGSIPEAPQPAGRLDEDVVAEMDQVQAAVKGGGRPDSRIAVQVRGLVKTYAGRRELKCGCCCSCNKIPPFHAVKGSWFNIENDKLFCLLGPNGAGKTTTINCLTGVIPTTSGDAIVNGESIRSPEGMTNIRSTMGVCPQFDILWDTLTGREHLWMFANIKGLPADRIPEEIEELLQSVKLVDAGNMRSASYSGGMKRRLSVAIALIGNPKIVYLDEPTTGMDPISRRHVWDVVEKAKKGRAIVLTTHSMEEADILGDRIAIMAKGQLRCIGTSIHLKTRFGAGYIMNVSVKKGSSTAIASSAAAAGGGGGDGNSPVNQRGSVKDDMDARLAPVLAFFKQTLGVDPNEINKAYVSFLIPRSKEGQLSKFFATLREKKKELGISDTQLSLTTLEEVFLNIAKQAELESAAAEGRFEKLTLGDGRTISVPVGAQYVVIPDSVSQDVPGGLMVEVFWQQDEQGSLRISHSSDPRPAPSRRADKRPALQPSLSSRSSFGLSMGRRVEPSGTYDNPLRVDVIDMEDVRRAG